tara:strand:+ start:114 stop:317 length:204 start_codon:yes stop_codon:yes gene_type:complete
MRTARAGVYGQLFDANGNKAGAVTSTGAFGADTLTGGSGTDDSIDYNGTAFNNGAFSNGTVLPNTRR